VVSVDQLGQGPSELAIVVPITRTHRTTLDVKIDAPEGGLDETSYAQPYQVRTVRRTRLIARRGSVRDATLTEVITRVRLLLRPPA
jgi:mRNA-degrading endonuclease toxin of MazEF toxin-antitoxin module